VDPPLEGAAWLEQLHEEHLLVLDSFHQIEVALQQGRLPRVGPRVVRFGQEFQLHLVREQRLLAILERHYRHDLEISGRLQQERAVRDRLGREVRAFVERFGELEVGPGAALEFSAMLDAIGVRLLGQIEREEERLFPLYDAG
jgi:hypothetical protein